MEGLILTHSLIRDPFIMVQQQPGRSQERGSYHFVSTSRSHRRMGTGAQVAFSLVFLQKPSVRRSAPTYRVFPLQLTQSRNSLADGLRGCLLVDSRSCQFGSVLAAMGVGLFLWFTHSLRLELEVCLRFSLLLQAPQYEELRHIKNVLIQIGGPQNSQTCHFLWLLHQKKPPLIWNLQLQ